MIENSGSNMFVKKTREKILMILLLNAGILINFYFKNRILTATLKKEF